VTETVLEVDTEKMKVTLTARRMKKIATKKPNLGDKIEHTCTLNGTFKGEVVQLLAMQFVYRTDKGDERFCLFKESWRFIKDD
jgi:hypothetical protein